ncbi:MAG: hypothetical protein CMC69_01865 [Flavobacteriaceae bacterium]|nr:hypothetical protein [Flavobacteriaceae bacterium]|tara:strand:+ start:7195 stop:8751 length:1557 start_codon:yes stop_codon:yes gene_type:complete
MSAIVTDQFRILNANNFIESVESDNNSYYVFIGLPNPTLVGYGRSVTWNVNTPDPVDNFSSNAHSGDTMMFGRKISSANIRRIVKRVDWTAGTKYEIYRDDYSSVNQSPIMKASRLYDASYYVMNSDYKVYICIDNGSMENNLTGNISQDEPNFTDLEPSRAGNSGDGYIWKYLYTVSPSDIIKFDSTEYITVPNSWDSSTDSQIRSVRENGDSSSNSNQIKHVYIERQGGNYADGLGQECNIIGDGIGAKARVDVVNGKITDVTVSAGGKGYSYGLVDLGSLNSAVPSTNRAKLIPIIPPSLGHGYDAYTELGTDKVLIYARFDDSTKDFPTDTKFAQVGIVKNPTAVGTANTYTETNYSSLASLKFSTISGTPSIGEKITQVTANGNEATGYVASYDKSTNVLKFFRDRSLNYTTTQDQTDYAGISTTGQIYAFESSSNAIRGQTSSFSGSIDTGFTGISTNPTGTKLINLGSTFVNGLSQSEINKGSGEFIYLDNRPLIARNERQKEDVKIILEF